MPFMRPEDLADPAIAVVLLDLLYGLIPQSPVTTVPTSTGTIATVNSTNNLPIPCTRLNPAGAITGMILAPGAFDGQCVELMNISANSVTFAASGTSNVADGTSDVIAAATSQIYRWDATGSLWYHQA